jgi:D-alanine-D-alanine ligase
MKKNIAVVWGGYSSEKVVSEKSAEGISSFIDKDRYNIYKVRIDRESWMVEYNNDFSPVDKNDFSFVANEEKIVFDFVYNTIHGTPGED